MDKRLKHSLIALAVAGAFPLHSVSAQEAQQPAEEVKQPGQLETVIVTAQRRAENIKDVPMAIATVKGEKLDVLTSGGQDIRFLNGRSPSVSVESDYGRTFPRFYIRGLGNTDFDLNASQPVGLVMDDIVMENPMLKGFPVFDVDQIEVLRGPQGTLFGRNSPAGVIKFDSAKPVLGKTEGYANIGFGKEGMRNLEGAFNLPVNDTLAFRFSAQSQHRDDRVHNPRPTGTQDFEGYDDHAVRLQALVKPSKDFSALFNIHARNMDTTATLFRANILKKGTNELVDGFDYYSYPSDGFNNQWLKTRGGSIRLRWDLPNVTLHSITGYEKLDLYSRADVDGGYGADFNPPVGPFGGIPFPLETADLMPNHRQFTQEFRAESNGKGPLQWIGGLFFFNENIQIDSISFNTFNNSSLNPEYTQQFQDARSWAAFGTLNYAVSNDFKMRAGLRYTTDKKDFIAQRIEPNKPVWRQTLADTSHNVSWDLSGTYTLDKDINLFGRIATGYRAPSMQGRLYGIGDMPTMAKAEKALSYEFGVKADLMNRRARASLTFFRYDMDDKQLTAGSGAVNMNRLINADKVTGQGVELDLQANLGYGFSGTFGSSYNDTEIKDAKVFDSNCGGGFKICTVLDPQGPFPLTASLNGNDLPRAPRWQHNFSLKYSTAVGNGELYAYTDWAYRSTYNFFLYEAVEYKAKSLLEGGLRIGYKWDNYEIAAYGRNITNRIQALGAISINNLTGIVNEPRTYGVQFKATF
ncbi:TonB-dependent receptor [Pseudoduganella sp. DS3]|uniref:TonB-dependent receptor n=1 Tax=Pseudoduganella guangdongensis TaxID=2692179 RepID=A0A6N9HDV4_9BURK|nr:TonB-dependent receptor [Pseudoduganella guangdongensis]MYN01342.1 TonB-dependent receptor [Pseudoduganella guangdongensis]